MYTYSDFADFCDAFCNWFDEEKTFTASGVPMRVILLPGFSLFTSFAMEVSTEVSIMGYPPLHGFCEDNTENIPSIFLMKQAETTI